MPSVSEKQRRTMEKAKADPAFRKKMGIPKKVADEFVRADRNKARGKRKS